MSYNKYLPPGNDLLKQPKDYIELGDKMPEGEYKYRIVMGPIGGWRYWGADGKPVRCRPENKPKIPMDPNNPLKSFWALYVWDYKREGLFILEPTQVAIINGLEALIRDPDWGDPTSFDFKLKKEGSGLSTKYSVSPVPHRPLDQCIKDALKVKPVRLEALYDCGNPWTDLEPSSSTISDFIGLSEGQSAQIDALLQKVNDMAVQKQLETNFRVNSLHNIPEQEFTRAITALENHIKSKQEKTHDKRRMASVA